MSAPLQTGSEPAATDSRGARWSAERGTRRHGFQVEGERPRLLRSRDHRIATGLCGGIAEFTGASPSVVRLLFVLTSVVSLGVVAAGYVVLSLLIPAAPRG